MEKHSIAVVSNDDALSTELEQRLTDAGYEVTTGTIGALTHDRIRIFRPDLVVLDLLDSTADADPVEDVIEDDPETRNIPILLCSDNAELLPDRVKGSTQAAGAVQASTRSVDEIVAKAEWILHRQG